MSVNVIACAAAIVCFLAAALNWRGYGKARHRWRRTAFLIAAAGSLAGAVAESCIAIWADSSHANPVNSRPHVAPSPESARLSIDLIDRASPA